MNGGTFIEDSGDALPSDAYAYAYVIVGFCLPRVIPGAGNDPLTPEK